MGGRTERGYVPSYPAYDAKKWPDMRAGFYGNRHTVFDPDEDIPCFESEEDYQSWREQTIRQRKSSFESEQEKLKEERKWDAIVIFGFLLIILIIPVLLYKGCSYWWHNA